MIAKAASKKTKSRLSRDATKDEQIAQYEAVFEQITSFTDAIKFHDEELTEARLAATEAKEAYDKAKEIVREIEEARDGARHSLVRYLCPRNGEVLPLFDTMEESDEEVHGKHSSEWRAEPVANLKLSVNALKALVDNDIMLVGQLQDRVLASPRDWWEQFSDLGQAVAAAIVDKLNNFIFEKTKQ